MIVIQIEVLKITIQWLMTVMIVIQIEVLKLQFRDWWQ